MSYTPDTLYDYISRCIEQNECEGKITTKSSAEFIVDKLVNRIDETNSVVYAKGGTENPVCLRDLETGVYVIDGDFITYTGSEPVYAADRFFAFVFRNNYDSNATIIAPDTGSWYFKITDSEVTEFSEFTITDMAANIGDLTQLATEDKTSLVAAINELSGRGGGGMPAPEINSTPVITITSEVTD